MERSWIGIDVGKEFHWAVAVDENGQTLLSRRVDNDEVAILALIDEIRATGQELTWATDMPGGPATLALTLLFERDQRVVLLPGIAVDRSRAAYRGEAKTDARDAYLIADQARMRRDLAEVRPSDEVLADLKLLVSYRRDLVAEQTRWITRLRDTLLGVFPALERSLDLTTVGALELIARYQTPSQIRRAGASRIERHLRSRRVRKAADLTQTAVAAAGRQSVRIVGEDTAASIAADLAELALKTKQRIAKVDADLEQRFFSHPQAEILASLPGMGPRLGAEFLVAVGDLACFTGPDQLAAYAGLIPVVRDSGKRVGNYRRMRGGNKTLKRVFYQSAFASLKDPTSRAFYDRKRGEGKRHHQALLALARRRVNVLWAMLRDQTLFKASVA
jgi:transposase